MHLITDGSRFSPFYAMLDSSGRICYNEVTEYNKSARYAYRVRVATESHRIYYTYDGIGNPLTYNGWDMSWRGRQLMEISKNGGQVTYEFTYNDAGIRTSKNVNGSIHHYALDGSQILSESWGNHFILYLYDESGAPIGLKYRTASYAAGVFDTYYFEKNIFGDIIGVYTEAGVKIGSYTYDAWGNITTTVSAGNTSLQNTVVRNFNPFRYRGYFYDYETGLYYLQSRYYDPVTGRFINADGLVSTGQGLLGYNMYAYCNNNPAMLVDTTGGSPLPFELLSYPGQIHLAVQLHIKFSDKNKENPLILEMCVPGGRIDLIRLSNPCEVYEVKPCTYYGGYRLLGALAQLQGYIDVYDGICVLGSEIEGATFYYGDFRVTYWYEGSGIILYSFQYEPDVLRDSATQFVVPPVPSRNREISYFNGDLAGGGQAIVTCGICTATLFTAGLHMFGTACGSKDPLMYKRME